MFHRLCEAIFFLKLELKSVFHQNRSSSKDLEKTASATKYDNFEFLVMPIGLRNARAAFQALMNDSFKIIIDDYLVIYPEDMSFRSIGIEEFFQHHRTVLKELTTTRNILREASGA